MKYVMGFCELRGWYVPVVFPDEVTHASIGLALNKREKFKILSAGFVHQQGEMWTVDLKARSESLKIGPQLMDQIVLNLFLRQGLAGLQLNNAFALLEIEAMKKGK